MENITIQDILEATDGTLLCGDPSMKIDHLSTNSMEIGPNTLFVPIIGERVDAHIFIPNALKEGGACLTQEHTEASGNAPYIKVPDTLTAMQQIAAYYRNKMSLPIIGVTGSVGKTTTREMIAHVLKGKYKVFETIGNQNSQVGVPLTLDHLTSEDEIGVLEMGMSEKGQITTLGNNIHPNVGVVTNVGVSHIEMMGSRDNICIEKLDIQNGLPEDGVLFLNGDNDMIRKHIDYVKKQYEFYGFADDCTYRAEKIREKGGQTLFEFHYGDMKEPITLNVLGKHNVSNALSAIAVADLLGVPFTKIKEGLKSFHGTDRRFEYKGEVNGVTVIDDYAHHPTEINATLTAAKEYPHKEIWCIFQPHTYTRTKALFPEFVDALTHADHVILADIYAARETDTLGMSSEMIAEELKKKGCDAYYFPSFEEIENFCLDKCQKGDVLITMGAGNVVNIGENLLKR